MSQQCESPITLTSGEALARYRRVKLTAAKTVSYADQADSDGDIGVTQAAVALAEKVSVRLNKHAGSFKVTAAGAFAVNATLYAADDGKVDDVVLGNAVFQALEAATADGDIVEALRL